MVIISLFTIGEQISPSTILSRGGGGIDGTPGCKSSLRNWQICCSASCSRAHHKEAPRASLGRDDVGSLRRRAAHRQRASHLPVAIVEGVVLCQGQDTGACSGPAATRQDSTRACGSSAKSSGCCQRRRSRHVAVGGPRPGLSETRAVAAVERRPILFHLLMHCNISIVTNCVSFSVFHSLPPLRSCVGGLQGGARAWRGSP